jgi:hypothetical protein
MAIRATRIPRILACRASFSQEGKGANPSGRMHYYILKLDDAAVYTPDKQSIVPELVVHKMYQ